MKHYKNYIYILLISVLFSCKTDQGLNLYNEKTKTNSYFKTLTNKTNIDLNKKCCELEKGIWRFDATQNIWWCYFDVKMTANKKVIETIYIDGVLIQEFVFDNSENDSSNCLNNTLGFGPLNQIINIKGGDLSQFCGKSIEVRLELQSFSNKKFQTCSKTKSDALEYSCN